MLLVAFVTCVQQVELCLALARHSCGRCSCGSPTMLQACARHERHQSSDSRVRLLGSAGLVILRCCWWACWVAVGLLAATHVGAMQGSQSCVPACWAASGVPGNQARAFDACWPWHAWPRVLFRGHQAPAVVKSVCVVLALHARRPCGTGPVVVEFPFCRSRG